MGWFGSLTLAYKYVIVFLSLLVLTISAGLVKVFLDRRKLKKFTKDQENGNPRVNDDQTELNQREKDEGDLFGIRAIEAGFYAGIPQSRPTSRAGSYSETPSMSSTTLRGSLVWQKLQQQSPWSSATSLPLAHATDRSQDPETVPSTVPSQSRSSPIMRLQPSEAEVSGRINHSASTSMTLAVPPSLVIAGGRQSPTPGSSESGESDGQASLPSLSPRSATFMPDHYSPGPPQIPIPEGLTVAINSSSHAVKSQTASLREGSLGNSAPSSPKLPEVKVISMPARAMRDGPRSPLRASSGRKTPNEWHTESAGEAVDDELSIQDQRRTYQATHGRDNSDSSVYSNDVNDTKQQHKRSGPSASS